jgi:putrescine transport system permease protein
VALAHDDALIAAAWLSLRIAAMAATGAAVLGTIAGVAMARAGRFPFRGTFEGLLMAPLVLPDLLIGLALLLLFIAAEQLTGWPDGRGVLTVTLAHVTMCLAYVAVTVQARLRGGDILLEQAAMDLGATPWLAFRRITLPLLAPAVLAGWLLAFTVSFDDVIVASFTSGPGASTLPMVVFSTLKLGATPILNALATAILTAVALVLTIAWMMQRR